jgi:hypothetical protein
MSKYKPNPFAAYTSIDENSKVVTLYLQAHGEQGSDEIDNIIGLQGNLDLKNVNLLSFCGFPGFIGETNTKCSGYNDYATDIWTMDNLKYLYRERKETEIKENRIIPKSYQWNILSEIADILRIGFKTECDIEYPGYGFRQTLPRSERLFKYFPTEHENCIKCLGAKDDSTCEYIEESDVNKHHCPEYGIVVIESSEIDDMEFTLINSTEYTTKELNLRSIDSNAYWHSKAINGIEILKQKYIQEKRQKTKAINRLTNKINTFFTDIIKPESEKPSSTLTEILQAFSIMGFTHIIILDPTCRAIERYISKKGDYDQMAAFKHPVSIDIQRKEKRGNLFSYDDDEEEEAPTSFLIERDNVVDLEPLKNTKSTTWSKYLKDCVGEWCNKKTKKTGKITKKAGKKTKKVGRKQEKEKRKKKKEKITYYIKCQMKNLLY